MHKKFITTLTINSIAHFAYKIALLTHQILLYTIITPKLYGIQSTLFAITYMAIAITNFGFDETLSPFFARYISDRQACKNMFLQFCFQIIFIASLIIFILAIYNQNLHEYLHTINIDCKSYLPSIIFVIFLLESIKKTLTTFLQLAFFTTQIAISQVCAIAGYIICVWGWYSHTRQLTLPSLFLPMIIIGVAEIIFLSYLAYTFYRTIPHNPHAIPADNRQYLRERLLNYFFQINKVLFSPNTLTVAFAYLLGFSQAATIKFYTNLITLAYTCIAKVIGVTTGAIFTHLKSTVSIDEVMKAFQTITKRYMQFLYILAGTTTLVIMTAYYNEHVTTTMATYIIIFFIMGFLETYAITYEQLYIAFQQSVVLSNVNAFNIIIAFVTLWGVHSLSCLPVYALTCIMISKVISLRYLHRNMRLINKPS
jgi:hypothetical protein